MTQTTQNAQDFIDQNLAYTHGYLMSHMEGQINDPPRRRLFQQLTRLAFEIWLERESA